MTPASASEKPAVTQFREELVEWLEANLTREILEAGAGGLGRRRPSRGAEGLERPAG